MIYCVIPEALAGELLDSLTTYYEADPNVEVIVDRRASERRGKAATPGGLRERRDRRRTRATGDFQPLESE